MVSQFKGVEQILNKTADPNDPTTLSVTGEVSIMGEEEEVKTLAIVEEDGFAKYILAVVGYAVGHVEFVT